MLPFRECCSFQTSIADFAQRTESSRYSSFPNPPLESCPGSGNADNLLGDRCGKSSFIKCSLLERPREHFSHDDRTVWVSFPILLARSSPEPSSCPEWSTGLGWAISLLPGHPDAVLDERFPLCASSSSAAPYSCASSSTCVPLERGPNHDQVLHLSSNDLVPPDCWLFGRRLTLDRHHL